MNNRMSPLVTFSILAIGAFVLLCANLATKESFTSPSLVSTAHATVPMPVRQSDPVYVLVGRMERSDFQMVGTNALLVPVYVFERGGLYESVNATNVIDGQAKEGFVKTQFYARSRDGTFCNLQSPVSTPIRK